MQKRNSKQFHVSQNWPINDWRLVGENGCMTEDIRTRPKMMATTRLLTVVLSAVFLAACLSPASAQPIPTLTPQQTAAVERTLDGFYALFTNSCSAWVSYFHKDATFFHPKAGVVRGVEALYAFCLSIQPTFKVQEFRRDGPFTWVAAAPDLSALNVLAPALYLNDAPYVNSQYQFFKLRNNSTRPEVAYWIDEVSELLTRTQVPFSFPPN